MNINYLTVIASTILLLSVVGCGNDAGVDAESATEGGPRQKEHLDKQERVQAIIKQLEETDFTDAEGNQRIGMKIGGLGAFGADGEPALPILHKIADEVEDENIRTSANHAIKSIEEAVANQN